MKFSPLRNIGHTLTHGALFGLSAAFTVVFVSLVYAGVTNIYYSDLPTTSSGSGLTATSWNNLVNYANKAVKQDTEVLTVTGGNVGIGTVNPGTKLEVNGDIKAIAGGTIGVTKASGTFGSAINIPNNAWTYIGDNITLTPGNWIVYYNSFYDTDGVTAFSLMTYNHPGISTNTNSAGIISLGNLGVCGQNYCPINQVYQISVASTTTYYIIHLINGYTGSYARLRLGWGNFYAIKVN
ncbi:MAG: hypothetical protein PHH16_04735 [Candidatus Gracilibacteria bacterium]|nr:hypothetical protein [Candidatus Gracilibacteria bacterium]